MKTFLNVLYRRILYKIPLKFLLVLLVISVILIASFSRAENVEDIITYIKEENVSVGAYSTKTIYELNNSSDYGTYCLYINNLSDSINIGFNSSLQYIDNLGYRIYSDNPSVSPYFCIFSNLRYIFFYNTSSSQVNVNYKFFKLNALINTQLPVLTSLECQTQYNLIPISSVDSNYCTTNNLCPSQECPSVPIGTGEYSELYINNILHVGSPTILMNISDEIDWDYAYTMGGNVMNIDIVGYNVDYQAVEDEIIIQKYKPNSSDLSAIISNIIPLFVPGLCIILLLYFIFKFIKKVF